MMKAPNERARLYFLLAWFHAVVQERLRYVPLGWAKYYEFNESDLRVACDTLDTWIESTAMVSFFLSLTPFYFQSVLVHSANCVNEQVFSI
jgi:hypothetical protein